MRTVIIIGAGFLALGVFLLAARWLGGGNNAVLVTTAQVFIAVWLVAAGLNMWVGVAKAGYSVAEELPIFLVIFALPASASAFVWWKFS